MNFAEANEWNTSLKKNGNKIELIRHETKDSIFGCPSLVTADAKKAISGSDVIIISLPAFAHEVYFKHIYDNIDSLKKGTIIAVFPGAAGLELCCVCMLYCIPLFCFVKYMVKYLRHNKNISDVNTMLFLERKPAILFLFHV